MSPNLINITANKKLLAIVVRQNFPAKPHQFLTDKNNPLQLGVLKGSKNQIVKPHLHRQITKTTHKNQEFIYLVSGQLKVEFFYRRRLVKTLTLNPGDCLLQLTAGHGFKFTKDSKIITIKQGPYHSPAKEKTFIPTSS